MVTSPITTPHFHSRVLALLSSSLSEAGLSYHDGHGAPFTPLVIPPLSPVDTPLTPDESTSQIIAVSSMWTDLCSPDPFIAAVSRDILKLEIVYAAFCGISYVLIPGPRLRQSSMCDGSLARYARAILEALDAGPYIQLQIWMPMIDHPRNTIDQIGDLAPFARSHFVSNDAAAPPQKLDLFGTWAAWDLIRSLCKYHGRLCLGKECCPLVGCRDIWCGKIALIFASSSSLPSPASSPNCHSSEMALRAGANTHAGHRVVYQKPKRLPSLIKGTPSLHQSLHAPSHTALAATL